MYSNMQIKRLIVNGREIRTDSEGYMGNNLFTLEWRFR